MKSKRIARIRFLDHSEDTDADNNSIRPEECVLELFGIVVGENDKYIRVKTVHSSLESNSVYWNIVKSTIIELEEI